jgi:hypothetical protein
VLLPGTSSARVADAMIKAGGDVYRHRPLFTLFYRRHPHKKIETAPPWVVLLSWETFHSFLRTVEASQRSRLWERCVAVCSSRQTSMSRFEPLRNGHIGGYQRKSCTFSKKLWRVTAPVKQLKLGEAPHLWAEAPPCVSTHGGLRWAQAVSSTTVADLSGHYGASAGKSTGLPCTSN